MVIAFLIFGPFSVDPGRSAASEILSPADTNNELPLSDSLFELQLHPIPANVKML